MEFQFLVPENVRLSARISQWSNLKYIKTVMDNFDDRLRADFRNSCLAFLADVLEIQFSAQLIQALVCRGILCDKFHELWFNMQGHLTRFGLQEYAIVTRLLARSFSKGDRYTKALEKRRLKEKYFKSLEKLSCAQLEKAFLRASTPWADRYKLGLALIVEGVIIAPDNNVSIDEDTLAIWMTWSYFFRTPGPNAILDDHARRVVGTQFHEAAPASGGDDGSTAGNGHDDEFGVGAEDIDTSASDDHQTSEGNRDDGSKPADNGESDRDPSSETDGSESEDKVDASGWQLVTLPTPVVAPYLWGLGQHVTEEFARLRDFIATLVPPSSGTSTSTAAPVMNEPNLWDYPHEDGQGSDVRSLYDDDHAAEAKMQEGNDREGRDEQSPKDDDCAEEGDMQDMNGTA
ncbi:Hypothetical predicted protein [Olea europaea subsp. europaea]|uniref:DUF1985 domain-containing protein n=1 Tax=Olea europaea subsp. europaea TaxID=158383 RepID=A0A8S0S0K2_OLEEU|nr:Hypothetical predicted protein [Olea europaea subsp. europaea]